MPLGARAAPAAHASEANEELRLVRGRGRGAVMAESARRFWPLAACGVGAALLRLPFLFTGLGMDEGGYAYVAGEWAGGSRLYGPSAWIDRPQGLMVAYRLLLLLGEDASAIRLGALAFGCAITLLLGAIGWLLRDRATGIAAAAIYAVVGVSPHLQGFSFNGELAAALPATAAVAAALAWRRSPRRTWLLASGLAAAAAPLMKQSGIDGAVVAVAIVASASRPLRRRVASLGLLLLGLALPLGASALHGWLVGWHDYWFAVAGYKLAARSAAGYSLPVRLEHLGANLLDAAGDLAPAAVLALLGLAVVRRHRAVPVIALVWLGAAFAGFNLGGLYWRHYYVQLLPLLCLLAGMAATSFRPRLVRPLLVLSAALPVLVFLIGLARMPQPQRLRTVPFYDDFEADRRVAAALEARTRSTETILVLPSRPNVYFLADRRAAFPYLWGHPLHEIPGALASLRDLLARPARPQWVAVYAPLHKVDPSRRLERVLAGGYRVADRVSATCAILLRSLEPAVDLTPARYASIRDGGGWKYTLPRGCVYRGPNRVEFVSDRASASRPRLVP